LQAALTENKGSKNSVFRAQICKKQEGRISPEMLLYELLKKSLQLFKNEHSVNAISVVVKINPNMFNNDS